MEWVVGNLINRRDTPATRGLRSEATLSQLSLSLSGRAHTFFRQAAERRKEGWKVANCKHDLLPSSSAWEETTRKLVCMALDLTFLPCFANNPSFPRSSVRSAREEEDAVGRKERQVSQWWGRRYVRHSPHFFLTGYYPILLCNMAICSPVWFLSNLPLRPQSEEPKYVTLQMKQIKEMAWNLFLRFAHMDTFLILQNIHLMPSQLFLNRSPNNNWNTKSQSFG